MGKKTVKHRAKSEKRLKKQTCRTVQWKKTRSYPPPSSLNPFRIVIWNCQSVYPTHYGQWDSPNKHLERSLKNNMKRYAHHINILKPYLTRLSSTKASLQLDAICLQEVDVSLVQQVDTLISSYFPTLCVFPPELITEPYHRSGKHAYHMLTIVRTSRICHNSSHIKPYKAFQRFVKTSLDTCVIVNAHVPWVDDITKGMCRSQLHNLRKKQMNIGHLINAMRATIESHSSRNDTGVRPIFICGDLNVSSKYNMSVYERVFNIHHPSTQLIPVGESYNVSPDKIKGLKYFKRLRKPPDDAVLCDGHWNVQALYESLAMKKLPVNTHGYKDPDEPGIWPSDHALTEVILQ